MQTGEITEMPSGSTSKNGLTYLISVFLEFDFFKIIVAIGLAALGMLNPFVLLRVLCG